MSQRDTLHPPLRLLERPAPRPALRAQLPEDAGLGAWCLRQVERCRHWGERVGLHPLGSWLRH